MAALLATLSLSLSSAALAQSTTSSAEAALLTAAHTSIDHADWIAADRTLRQLVALAPSAAEPHYLLAQVLFREQRPKDSLAEYTDAAKLRMPTADELSVVASDYILLKDYADAEHWLRYAVERSPENARAWYLLGRTQYKLDHAQDAANSFKRCLERASKDVRAEYNLGLALERLDRPQEAEAAYRSAMEWQRQSTVKDAQPYLNLGVLLLSQGHASQALPLLQEAVTMGPRNAMAQQELGKTYEALGKYAEAADALKQATRLAPQAEPPHFLLGRMYRRLGKSMEAAEQFAEAKRLSGASSANDTPNEPQ